MNGKIDSGHEAVVAEALYKALRSAQGVRFVARSDVSKSFDNVLVNVNSGGINLRLLARAAIRAHERYLIGKTLGLR